MVERVEDGSLWSGWLRVEGLKCFCTKVRELSRHGGGISRGSIFVGMGLLQSPWLRMKRSCESPPYDHAGMWDLETEACDLDII